MKNELATTSKAVKNQTILHDQLVEIVWDHSKKKLRATPANGLGGWVRFPRKLRIEGAVYRVETLKEGAAGSWIACGKIEAANANLSIAAA